MSDRRGVGLLPLAPLEVHSGIIVGPGSPAWRARDRGPEPAGTPAETLAELLLPALSDPPCHILFSGGRDSSVVLAAAAKAATKHGLDAPIPLTARFPGHRLADETAWQQQVIDHLGLRTWRRIDVFDELGALGPYATQALRRHGQHWPSNAHSMRLFAERAGGGTIVTGGGGDETLSGWYWQRMGFREVLATVPRGRRARWLAYNALPVALRQRLLNARRTTVHIGWLRPDARVALRASMLSDEPPLPGWELELEQLMESRYFELIDATIRTFAGEHDVSVHEPLASWRMVRSVMAALGPDGPRSRSDALVRLFGDLLPEAVLLRVGKAVFTGAYWGQEARSFAAEWDGRGLDETIVDPAGLMEQWARPIPDARATTPLHAAWLSSDG